MLCTRGLADKDLAPEDIICAYCHEKLAKVLTQSLSRQAVTRVPAKAKQYDLIKVAPGYARNFLLPRRLAVAATESNKKIVEQERQAYLRKEAKVIGDAQDPHRRAAEGPLMSDHEIAQTAFSQNRERLKAERLAREAAATPVVKDKPKPKSKK